MNIFNKKTILFFSIATLMINGCVAKNEFETKSSGKVLVSGKSLQVKPVWAQVRTLNLKKKNTKKDDCLDCYASPLDYSKPPSASNSLFAKVIKKPVSNASKYYGAYDYKESASDTNVKRNTFVNVKNNVNKYVAPAVSYVNTSYGSYSNNTAIQVGAFRYYDGAKTYMKRYNALSSKYKVAIKTGTKNNKPLHRVRIEGFKNKAEAKKFMYSYGIRDAFVVIK